MEEIKELIDVDELTERICKTEYTCKLHFDDKVSTLRVSSDKAEIEAIRTTIKHYMAEKAPAKIAQRIAELEAKVYTYEKAIANSTFAPLLKGYISPLDHDKAVQELKLKLAQAEDGESFYRVRVEDLEKELKELKKGERSDE